MESQNSGLRPIRTPVSPVVPRYCNAIIRSMRHGQTRLSRIAMYDLGIVDNKIELNDFAASIRLLVATRRIRLEEPFPGFIYVVERLMREWIR